MKNYLKKAEEFLVPDGYSIEQMVDSIVNNSDQNELIDYVFEVQVVEHVEFEFTCKQFLELIDYEDATETISINDVIQVARHLKFNPTLSEMDEIIELYPSEQENDSSATWDLVVENLLYQICKK